MPVAGREAHIHLCLVSVVRSSTSGLLVASDTDSSPAPSPQPSSLQFVAVGIRRPRRQSYVVFQDVKKPLSFHSLRKVRDSNPRAIADLLLSRELPYHSANLPCCVCRNIIAAHQVSQTPRTHPPPAPSHTSASASPSRAPASSIPSQSAPPHATPKSQTYASQRGSSVA